MQPSLIILAAWLAFCGSHLLLSATGAREWLTPKLGALGFTLLFTFVSIVTLSGLIAVVAIYGGEGHRAFNLKGVPAVRLVLAGVSGAGAILAIAGLINYPNSPMARLARRMRDQDLANVPALKPPSAIDRVTRHPFFLGLGILSIAHIFLAATLATATFFAGLAILSLSGIPLQDRKLRNRWPAEYAAYQDQTSVVPFVGRQKPLQSKTGWTAWLVAVLGASVFIGLLHPVWAYANGATFAGFILLFGSVGVAAGVLKSRKKRGPKR